jgi:amino acid transporter
MAGPWQQITTQELPAAAAFRLAFDSELLARVVLVTGLFGIGTVGNACSIAVTRLLYSLSRSRWITPVFTRLHATRGSPVPAIVFATTFSLLGCFLGRAGLAPIVNVGSAVAAVAYLIASLSVIRLRRIDPARARPYRMPGGVPLAVVAALGSGFLTLSSFRQHWVDARGAFPLEWAILLVWAAIGLGLYRQARPERESLGEPERRRLMLGERVGRPAEQSS